jgi:hypothetical protein
MYRNRTSGGLHDKYHNDFQRYISVLYVNVLLEQSQKMLTKKPTCTAANGFRKLDVGWKFHGG